MRGHGGGVGETNELALFYKLPAETGPLQCSVMVVAHTIISLARSAALSGWYGGPVYRRTAATSARVSLAWRASACRQKSSSRMPS